MKRTRKIHYALLNNQATTLLYREKHSAPLQEVIFHQQEERVMVVFGEMLKKQKSSKTNQKTIQNLLDLIVMKTQMTLLVLR